MPHYIHIPKTGGTSLINDDRLNITYTDHDDIKSSSLNGIELYLNTYRNKPFGWIKEEKTFAHARYLDIETRYDSYFTVIRNPWDRMVSKWLYSIQAIDEWGIPYKVNSLEEYVSEQSLFRYEYKDFTWFTTIENWFDQVTYIENENGDIVTDNLRFEYFNQDIKKYLNFEPLWLRPSKLKTQDYKEYYNSKTIQLVADLYKRDIEMFGFDFDTSATKNYWE